MLRRWKLSPLSVDARCWRNICLAALLSAIATPAAAQVPPGCRVSPIDGAVINCTGNHTAGIAFNNGSGPFETLHVFALTSDITPPSGVVGIAFNSDTPGYVEVDLGPWKIVTTGDNAVGIQAETSLLTELTLFVSGNIATSGDNAEGMFASTSSGDLAILYSGTIGTAGDNSHGIHAQSGSSAFIYSAGNIRTSGAASVGILVESIGSADVFSQGSITTSGDFAAGVVVLATGDAVVYSEGTIKTAGADADGIAVISGTSNAAVINTGNVSATGVGSAGISVSAADTAIVLNAGHIAGGPCCAAVMMDAGSQAILLNAGTITAGLSGYAVDMLGPANNVLNFGTITGSVILSDDGFNPAGVFENLAGGVLNSGDLLVAAMVVNDGTIAPGGHGKTQTTFVSDNFTQTKHGIYAVDLDPRALNPSDRQDFIGVSNFASLTGDVAVNFISVPVTAAES
ncbi:MAG TPA: hypothetical protein VNR51_02795, partial [Hyphomicrobium sp.]|nr:hypothetical protein [Hyphomicrobium sp.]